MHIWVDADARPGVIKAILYRVAARTRLPLTLVANQWLKTPPYPSIRAIQVPKGFDVADNHIVDQAQAAAERGARRAAARQLPCRRQLPGQRTARSRARGVPARG